ncbi:hypothetical protein FDP41_010457 [Naegleria fowleri]|uniref:Uncharacterized protein n=1 Tax=Naegleria fowleri TaxID=5763 RepID=A0A6A5C8X2_NAEFO|nr:uncharacterized protein FDP41_010457 [Naegleria fowleri]KAF0983392.1 hypothetical protein FDP41_010457 [Naegleria fowleri]CAG4710210.1 unnamed protein product [Naegleria fowleri]
MTSFTEFVKQEIEPNVKEFLFWLEHVANIKERNEAVNTMIQTDATFRSKIISSDADDILKVFDAVVLNIEQFISIFEFLCCSQGNLKKILELSLQQPNDCTSLQIMQPLIDVVNKFYEQDIDHGDGLYYLVWCVNCFTRMMQKEWLKVREKHLYFRKEIHAFKKKKKLNSKCLSIDDEEFTPKSGHIDAQSPNEMMSSFVDVLSNSTQCDEKLQALNSISEMKELALQIFSNPVCYEALKELYQQHGMKDMIMNIMANVFAHSHHCSDMQQETLNCMQKLFQDWKFFFSMAELNNERQQLSSIQCRFIANGAFISDEFGCLAECFLPDLCFTIRSQCDLCNDANKVKLPHMNVLRAAAAMDS